jgi:hypothetical protein
MVAIALVVAIFLLLNLDVVDSWPASHKRAPVAPKLDPSSWLGRAGLHPGSRAQRLDGNCLSEYGDGYLERWRRLHGDYCVEGANPDPDKKTGTYSKIQCYAHPAVDLSACFGQNLVVDSTALLGLPSSTSLPSPSPGSVRVACTPNLEKGFLRGRLHNEGMRKVLIDALANTTVAEVGQACSGQEAVQHAVLLTMQRDRNNPFHNLEHVVSLFAALATLSVPAASLQEGLEASMQRGLRSCTVTSIKTHILAH